MSEAEVLKMKERASKGYALDLKKNIEIVSDDIELSRVFTWLQRMCYDFVCVLHAFWTVLCVFFTCFSGTVFENLGFYVCFTRKKDSVF